MPANGADVCIPDGVGSTTTVVHSTGTNIPNTLHSIEDFTLSGGILSITTEAKFDGAFSLTGDTLSGNALINLNGTFGWSGGTLGVAPPSTPMAG